MKTYDVTIIHLTNPSKGDEFKSRSEFTVQANSEEQAKQKALALDTSYYSVWEVYIS